MQGPQPLQSSKTVVDQRLCQSSHRYHRTGIIAPASSHKRLCFIRLENIDKYRYILPLLFLTHEQRTNGHEHGKQNQVEQNGQRELALCLRLQIGHNAV